MKSILKAIVPGFIKDPILLLRTIKGAETDHRRLNEKSVRLQEKHLKNLKVLPDRRSLLARMPKHGVVAEVGVAEGDFSEAILELCEPEKLHLIDAWELPSALYSGEAYQKVSTRFAEQIAMGTVVMQRGWSWEKIGQFSDGSLHWAYLDAGHNYESIKKDLAATLSKLKPGGIISGHDYVKWSCQTGRFGVVEAVNEFCIEHDFEMLYLTLEQNMHLSYAIRKIGEEEQVASIEL